MTEFWPQLGHLRRARRYRRHPATRAGHPASFIRRMSDACRRRFLQGGSGGRSTARDLADGAPAVDAAGLKRALAELEELTIMSGMPAAIHPRISGYGTVFGQGRPLARALHRGPP